MQFIFTLGQVLFGGFFLYSGFNHFKHYKSMAGYATSKKVPMPTAAVLLTGLLLTLGGLGIIFSIMTAWALVLISVFLFVTSFAMHNFWKSTEPMEKQMQIIQFTKNMALLGAALMLLALSW